MACITVSKKLKPLDFVFKASNGKHLLTISEELGIVFNEKGFIDWDPSNFADEFVKILERSFSVEIKKKESNK